MGMDIRYVDSKMSVTGDGDGGGSYLLVEAYG